MGLIVPVKMSKIMTDIQEMIIDNLKRHNKSLKEEVSRLRKQSKTFVQVHVSANEWEQALGNREKETHHEDCELQSCCANISSIRDWLLQCKEDGGMVQDDIQQLDEALKAHDKPTETPVLESILKQLGLEWTEHE